MEKMYPEEIISLIKGRFDGLQENSSWGERGLFYNPEGKMPRGIYFCTLKDRDGAHDSSSCLCREGIFRFSFGMPPEIYEKKFGARPERPSRGGVVQTGDDFSLPDTLMPHPVYAWMSWVQILSPSRKSFDEILPLLDKSYRHVQIRYEKRSSGGGI